MASLAPKSSSQGSALVARFLHPSHSSFPLHWESLRGSTIAGLGPFLPSAQGTGKQSCQHLHSSVQLTCLSPSPWSVGSEWNLHVISLVVVVVCVQEWGFSALPGLRAWGLPSTKVWPLGNIGALPLVCLVLWRPAGGCGSGMQ